ncbi:hypothetical protein EPO05_00130 [Patescibacteria group bacterium]|nr:MAG: hypothetical protein EPO05_00130 [Patescibacteria group bacterium]
MAEANNQKSGSTKEGSGKTEAVPPSAIALIAIIIGVVAVAIFLLRGQLMRTNTTSTKLKPQENIRWGVDQEEGNNTLYKSQEEGTSEPEISPDSVQIGGDTGSN